MITDDGTQSNNHDEDRTLDTP